MKIAIQRASPDRSVSQTRRPNRPRGAAVAPAPQLTDPAVRAEWLDVIEVSALIGYSAQIVGEWAARDHWRWTWANRRLYYYRPDVLASREARQHPDRLNLSAASRRSGVRWETLANWIKSGRLPAVKKGRWQVTIQDLEAACSAGKALPVSAARRAEVIDAFAAPSGRALTLKQARVIRLRYGIPDGDCLTLAETARRLKISRQAAFQCEKAALCRLGLANSTDS